MDSTSVERKVRVCVVGCGVSGAAAAAELVQAGETDVLVLEALNRPGGRVHTVKHGESYIELGAHWVHGEEGNCVFEWAKENCPHSIETGLDLTQTGMGHTIFITSSGETVPDTVVESFQELADQLDKSDMSGCTSSLGGYYEEQFSSLNEWGATGWQLLAWHGRFQSLIDGSASWHDVSAATRNQYWECPGNPVVNWNNTGYQTLLDHLLGQVGNERILLNSPVAMIQWPGSDKSEAVDTLTTAVAQNLQIDEGSSSSSSSTTTTTRAEGGPQQQLLTEQDGQKSACYVTGAKEKDVPSTNDCSSGSTEQGASNPDVGSSITSGRGGGGGPPPAQCRVTLCDGRAVLADHVIFSGSLGVLKSTAGRLFQPQLPQQKLRAIDGLGFDTVAKVYLSFSERWWPEDSNGFSFLHDLTGPPPHPTQEWEEHLLGFYTVWQQPLMLCSWMSGPSAVAMEEAPLAEVIERCYSVLQRRLRGIASPSKPVWGIRSVWGSNPYTRGSYSFRSCRSDECDVWASDLAQPLLVGDHPAVCFCGEATHDHYYSTVHGAWETGKREAHRLLQYWGHSPPTVSLTPVRGGAAGSQ